MSLYKKELNVLVVVFTDSATITKYVQSRGLIALPQTETNMYGMPYLSNMLEFIHLHINCQQIIYMNSDILINPGIFSLAKQINLMLQGKEVRILKTNLCSIY